MKKIFLIDDDENFCFFLKKKLFALFNGEIGNRYIEVSVFYQRKRVNSTGHFRISAGYCYNCQRIFLFQQAYNLLVMIRIVENKIFGR